MKHSQACDTHAYVQWQSFLLSLEAGTTSIFWCYCGADVTLSLCWVKWNLGFYMNQLKTNLLQIMIGYEYIRYR